MCSNNFESYNDLQQELEYAKDKLVVLNDNIKRIIGRSPKSRDCRSIEIKRSDSEKAIKKFQQDSFSSKKKRQHNFKRLSSFDDSEPKPRITSRVIRELPSRQEIVAAQCVDSESRARNRRIFGSLLGTLHKFCQEESRLKQREEKKAQIEKKLEEQEILERELLKKERETLFIDKKNKQMEIKRLELKMIYIKDQDTWEHSIKYLKNFIKTKTNPSIYYRPKVFTKRTERLLTENVVDVEKAVIKKREDLKTNLSKLEENFQFQEYETIDETDLHLDKTSKFFQSSSVLHNALVPSICHMKDRRCGLDSKENKMGNMGEAILSSSVFVVNH